jgi:hypothetical protein
MIFSENRFPRIKSGAGFFRIMLNPRNRPAETLMLDQKIATAKFL